MVLSSRSLCSCVREIDWALVFLHSINAGFGRVCIGVGVGGGDGVGPCFAVFRAYFQLCVPEWFLVVLGDHVVPEIEARPLECRICTRPFEPTLRPPGRKVLEFSQNIGCSS